MCPTLPPLHISRTLEPPGKPAWRPVCLACLACLSWLAQSARVSAEPARAWELGGWVEAFYQWNFADPSNGATNLRGFDNRHNAFTLSNVVLQAKWDTHGVLGRIALQVGHTPATYYSAEPAIAAAGSVNESDASLWSIVQQAQVGYRFEDLANLTIQAGVFLSPIGPESMAVRDNWQWSRSNLFFGLPFYHTGAQVSISPSSEWTLNLLVSNGWNSVVDNNDEKSLSLQALWSPSPRHTLSVLVFSGVERAEGAPEGRAWRHLLDLHGTTALSGAVSLQAHLNLGIEPNDFGTSAWAAGALALRLQVLPWLWFAARGDAFWENRAQNDLGTATSIFWNGDWVSSGTATVGIDPATGISFRIEFRHDQAEAPTFFRGDAKPREVGGAAEPSSRSQDTVTLGITSWF